MPSDDEATRASLPRADRAPPLPGDPGDGSTEAPLLGQVIAGRYRIGALLASGGMGSVYLAEHLQLRRRVAVKVLRPDTDNYEEMAARFPGIGKVCKSFGLDVTKDRIPVRPGAHIGRVPYLGISAFPISAR